MKPLKVLDIQNGISSAFILLCDVRRTADMDISRVGRAVLLRVIQYTAHEYNEIALHGTPFAPKPFLVRPEPTPQDWDQFLRPNVPNEFDHDSLQGEPN